MLEGVFLVKDFLRASTGSVWLKLSDKLFSLSRRYDKLKLIGHQTDPLLSEPLRRLIGDDGVSLGTNGPT
jgi:hypothetical protein